MARLIDQGKTHAVGSLLGFARGFDENDLYENLQWLANHQARIEQALFSQRQAERSVDLFLYDVTSKEGEDNFFAQFYSKGKKQIELLCDFLRSSREIPKIPKPWPLK